MSKYGSSRITLASDTGVEKDENAATVGGKYGKYILELLMPEEGGTHLNPVA